MGNGSSVHMGLGDLAHISTKERNLISEACIPYLSLSYDVSTTACFIENAATRASGAPKNIGLPLGSSKPLILYVNSYPLISQPSTDTVSCFASSSDSHPLAPLHPAAPSSPTTPIPCCVVCFLHHATPHSILPVADVASPGHHQPNATNRRSSPAWTSSPAASQRHHDRKGSPTMEVYIGPLFSMSS